MTRGLSVTFRRDPLPPAQPYHVVAFLTRYGTTNADRGLDVLHTETVEGVGDLFELLRHFRARGAKWVDVYA